MPSAGNRFCDGTSKSPGDYCVTQITVRGWSARCCGVAVMMGLLAPAAALAEAPPSPAMTLNLVLPPHTLPPLAARVMRDEATRIWAREGIRLAWPTSESAVPAGAPLIRISLIGKEGGPQRTQEEYILGDFLPAEGRIRMSVVAAARSATLATAASRRPRESYEYPLALGYVLGRVLAHEVGHALLGRPHSEAGLMEASFKPAAMADSRSAQFRLSQADAARLPRSPAEARLAYRQPADGEIIALEVAGADGAEVLTR